jgi:hypothetical protein
MAQLVVATFGVESDTTALLSSLLYLDLPKVFKDSFPEELFSLLLIVTTYSPVKFLENCSSVWAGPIPDMIRGGRGVSRWLQ